MMLTLMVSYCQGIVAVRELSMASLYTVKDVSPPILLSNLDKPIPTPEPKTTTPQVVKNISSLSYSLRRP